MAERSAADDVVAVHGNAPEVEVAHTGRFAPQPPLLAGSYRRQVHTLGREPDKGREDGYRKEP